jgi:hypothetical protein
VETVSLIRVEGVPHEGGGGCKLQNSSAHFGRCILYANDWRCVSLNNLKEILNFVRPRREVVEDLRSSLQLSDAQNLALQVTCYQYFLYKYYIPVYSYLFFLCKY